MNEKKLFRIGEVTPHTYLDLEYAIRKLEENQKESMVFLGKVGVGIPKEKLEKRDVGNYQLTFLCWMRKTATRVRQKNYRKPDVLPYVFVEVTGKLVYTIRNCWIILMHTDCRLPDFPERSR